MKTCCLCNKEIVSGKIICLREMRKKCKKCRFKPELCNHCYNDEVRIINEKIDFFGVGDTIKKLEYNII